MKRIKDIELKAQNGETINMRRIKHFRMILFITAVMICLHTGVFIKPTAVQAASKKAKITLEFTDGTKKVWKTGDKKISLGKKKLAYIYFGSYPQTEVTGKELTSKITGAKYDRNGVATVGGVKYKRISKEDASTSSENSAFYDWTGKTYAYFKYEPIKWRVLSNKSGKVLLLSEYGLDNQIYTRDPINGKSWEKCSIRKWLNESFYFASFIKAERKLINKVKLKYNANPSYDTDYETETKDRIFLLSINDIMNKEYGFSDNLLSYDDNRRCVPTDFSKAMGTWTKSDEQDTDECLAFCIWSIRGTVKKNLVECYENGYATWNGSHVYFGKPSVRPAIQLNLSSVIK